jgi:hypothetical protein
MSEDQYRQALETARRELAKLETERAELDRKIERKKQGILGLSQLVSEDDENAPSFMDLLRTMVGEPEGLTDGCRAVLRTAGTALTPTEVRDGLIALGYDLSGYSNVMASVHQILKRLVASQEAQMIRYDGEPDGKKAYVWSNPLARLLGYDSSTVPTRGLIASEMERRKDKRDKD